jgi:hypothetical protein
MARRRQGRHDGRRGEPSDRTGEARSYTGINAPLQQYPSRHEDRSGVDEPRRWRARPLIWIATLLTILAALVFLLWLAWSFYVVFLGHPSAFGFDPDRKCAQLGFSCGALSNFATSGLLLAIASAFLLWRLYRLLRRYQARAQTNPASSCRRPGQSSRKSWAAMSSARC